MIARPRLTVGPVRRALLALALGGFGIGTGEFVTLGLLPNIAHSLHVSIPQAGHLISAYALGVVVGAPLLTGAAVRLPRRRLLIVVALTMAALNVVSALMPGFTSLLIVRFLAGLPHGAYFGVASVVAAKLVPSQRRSSAVAVVFAGLTVANVIGVPATTLIGQHYGWRLVFVLVGAVEVLAAVAILAVVPVDRADLDGSAPQLRHELRAFRQPQIWLSLSIAMIGGGALFATFSYIAPMMTHVAGFPQGAITPLPVLFGLGMTAGNLIGARLADRALMRTIYLADARRRRPEPGRRLDPRGVQRRQLARRLARRRRHRRRLGLRVPEPGRGGAGAGRPVRGARLGSAGAGAARPGARPRVARRGGRCPRPPGGAADARVAGGATAARVRAFARRRGRCPRPRVCPAGRQLPASARLPGWATDARVRAHREES